MSNPVNNRYTANRNLINKNRLIKSVGLLDFKMNSYFVEFGCEHVVKFGEDAITQKNYRTYSLLTILGFGK